MGVLVSKTKKDDCGMKVSEGKTISVVRSGVGVVIGEGLKKLIDSVSSEDDMGIRRLTDLEDSITGVENTIVSVNKNISEVELGTITGELLKNGELVGTSILDLTVGGIIDVLSRLRDITGKEVTGSKVMDVIGCIDEVVDGRVGLLVRGGKREISDDGTTLVGGTRTEDGVGVVKLVKRVSEVVGLGRLGTGVEEISDDGKTLVGGTSTEEGVGVAKLVKRVSEVVGLGGLGMGVEENSCRTVVSVISIVTSICRLTRCFVFDLDFDCNFSDESIETNHCS